MEADTTEFPSVSCKVRDTYTDPLNPVWVQSTPKTHKTPELTSAEKEKRRRKRYISNEICNCTYIKQNPHVQVI